MSGYRDRSKKTSQVGDNLDARSDGWDTPDMVAIYQCLYYLEREAERLEDSLLAHLIGVARERAADVCCAVDGHSSTRVQ